MNQDITDLLFRCGTDSAVLPPTELFNEGWLLRLTLDWFDRHRTASHPFAPTSGAKWYSEALLASRFLPRRRGDPLAESFTHADGLVGHFEILPGERGEATVSDHAEQLVVIEAKLGSLLSKGVKNAANFGQASRNVACMAHIIRKAHMQPGDFSSLGFYVVAPERQIQAGVFEDFVTKERINLQVKERVAQYKGEHDNWFMESFLPTLATIEVGLVAWESVLAYIDGHNPNPKLLEFYSGCLRFNPMRG